MSAIKFLGSSVRYYSASIGWGTVPSEIKIGLVDDDMDGDSFLPRSNPSVYLPGMPLIFTHGSFSFGGIFQNYEVQRGEQGDPLYEVSMFDPRIILEGVQLILDGYNGGVGGIDNLINIYGLLESQNGFGYSNVNDSGMPWEKVVEGINYATNNPYTGYGGGISYRGYSYGVYISQLPNLPSYYRIGGGSISLLDFIQDICEAGAFDWFCSLEGNNILITTIDRAATLSSYGAITNFASSVSANQTNAGTELIDNVTSKFVVGGNMDRMYYNYYQEYGNDTEDSGADDNTIWPFWGFDGEDIDGTGANAILGEGQGDDHHFTIDARGWAIYGIPDFYKTDIYELRAALDSQESWEALLWLRNDIPDSPQYGRATTVGIIGDINQALTTLLSGKSIEEFSKLTMLTFSNMTTPALTNSYNFDHNKNVKILYDYIRGFAEEYYGRKFMVRVPFVYSANVPEENNKVRFSEEPTDSGYLTESEIAQGISQLKVPYDYSKFTNEDDKFTAYVRFDDVANYDFSEIPDSDKFPVLHQGIWYMFVKCSIDEKYVFLNKYTSFSPRAVLTLPGVVKRKVFDENLFCGVIYDYLLYEMTRPTRQDAISKPEAKLKADDILKSIGGDILQMGKESEAIYPIVAAIPLRSNVLSYGPWYAVGGNGKVEFERDESLVPWNFGGYTLMNQIANAKVSSAYSNQLLSETGSVTFPGAPEFNMGSQLVLGGPYISDVNCSIGEGGILTTYNMKVYSPDFGKLRKYTTDRMTKLAKDNQQNRRRFRQFYSKKQRERGIGQVKNQYYKSLRAKRDKSNSSHTMLCGETVGSSGVGYTSTVLTQPSYNTVTQLYKNYEKKGGVSLDGLFRPFSTNPNASGIGHYELGSGTINANALNPYKNGHDIQAVIYGDVPDGDLVIGNLDGVYPSTISYRPLALRGPLVLTGWGYDTDDNPVPSKPLASGEIAGVSGVAIQFADNYLQRSDLWKTGPVDIRWNDEKKLWVASGGDNNSKIVKVLQDGIVPPSGNPSSNYQKVYKCRVYDLDFVDGAGNSVGLQETNTYIYAGNFRSLVIITDRYYIAHKIGSKYALDVYSEFTDGST